MTTPTAAQIETLLNFLMLHQDLARGILSSVEGRTLSRRLWEEISTTLNAMGGCTKSTKQWQKVWTDKKYLAKKAAIAARRSASGTGGGPSTAPQLSQWESMVVSIMGEGFGEPQTTARVSAFDQLREELPVLDPSVASVESAQEDIIHVVLQAEEVASPEHAQPGPSRVAPVPHNSARQQRRSRRQSVLQAHSSVRDRLFRFEEQRAQREQQRNEQLSAIQEAVVELRRSVREASVELTSTIREATVELTSTIREAVAELCGLFRQPPRNN